MILKRQLCYLITLSNTLIICSSKSRISNCDVTDYSQVSDAVANCDEIVVRDMVVPEHNTLSLNLKNGTVLTFQGTITFAYAAWGGPLVEIRGNNITVQGASGSLLDGQGPLYWDGKGSAGSLKPGFFLIRANKSQFRNISLLNCPRQCTSIHGNEVTLSGWNIDCSAGNKGVATLGKEGHNTDGFDVNSATQVTIKDSIVKNQDDCVAINQGSDMKFSNLRCSGSHGLSLSVGKKKTSIVEENTVSNVEFSDCVVVDADTAIHVKTHSDGGLGIVSNITYRNIQFSGIADYGIKIQEDYEDGGSTGVPKGNIPITNLNLINVTGSVSGKKSVPVYILCGSDGCSDWNWSEVEVSGGGKNSSCNFSPSGYQC